MTNINQLSAGMDGNVIGTSTSTLSLQHQQAWLRALERTGLNDAFLKTEVFSTPGKKTTALTSEQSKTDASMQRETEDTESSQKANTTLPKSDQEGSGENNQQQLSPTTSTVEKLGALMVVGQEGQSIIKLPNNQLFNLLNKGSYFTLAWKELQYPMRNMVMTRSDAEAEIWVRDATMSEARLMEILTGVRQSMGNLGVSLAKVVLNGQIVFSSQESGKEISHLTEV